LHKPAKFFLAVVAVVALIDLAIKINSECSHIFSFHVNALQNHETRCIGTELTGANSTNRLEITDLNLQDK